MYKCNECEKRFVEPEEEKTTYEIYYGIPEGRTPLIINKCPYCKSEDIQEMEIKEDE